MDSVTTVTDRCEYCGLLDEECPLPADHALWARAHEVTWWRMAQQRMETEESRG